MKQFNDLLKYKDKVKEVKTTNYIVDTIEVLEDMLFITKSLTQHKKSLILYSFLKLNFVWGSQYEKLNIPKHFSYSFLKQLHLKGFIQKRMLEDNEQRYLCEFHKYHPKDISKFEAYYLTDKGRDYLESKEILDSLKLIVSDELKYFNDELNNRLKHINEDFE